MKYQYYIVIIMLLFISLLGACNKPDQQEELSPSTPNDTPSISVTQPINNELNNAETTTVDETPTMSESPKISVGVVKIISDGIEYEPRKDGIYGLSDGIFYDAVRIEVDEIADLLTPIPVGDDFQIVIDGGIRNRTERITYDLYELINGEWAITSQNFGDFPEYSTSTLEPGEYILRIPITWDNGMDGADLEYLGVMHSFKISK